MTRTKLAVSVPAPLVAEAKAAVAAGHSASVSALVSEALAEKFERERLDEVLAAMEAEHGPVSAEAAAWARAALWG